MKRILSILLAVLTASLLFTAAMADEDWYFAGTVMDGEYVTAEALGSFMHIQLRDDGTAANISQSGEETIGAWHRDENQVTITFAGSDAVFTEENGRLVTTLSSGNTMEYTHEVAGTYIPGNLVLAESADDFDGSWRVKWIWSNNTYQSVEYLQRNFDLNEMGLELIGGILFSEEANYGLTLQEGLLIFGTDNQLSMVFGLQDDGMLCYVDYTNQIAYYCEKVE